MTYLSIIEKIRILFNTLLGFEDILVFMGIILVLTFIYCIKEISSKCYIILMIISFIGIFGFSIVNNYDVLSKTFDDFATIIFRNIYFPNIYVYIGVLVISFIAFITSIFNVMLKKSYKMVNSIMFIINNILFVVILNIIAENKIDIFSIESLYTNTTLVAILELSMGLFIIWLLSLIVIYTTNVICDKLLCRKYYIKQEKVFNPIIEIDTEVNENINNTLEEPIYQYDFTRYESNFQEEVLIDKIDNNIKNIETETFEDSVIEEIVENNNLEEVLVEQIDNNITFNDVLNDGIEYYSTNVESTKHDENKLSVDEITEIQKVKAVEENSINNTISLNDLIEEEDNSIPSLVVENGNDYSVEDYRKIIEILNVVKTHSNSNSLSIDDAVALSLISNYSVDDCLKFKNIIESNLN